MTLQITIHSEARSVKQLQEFVDNKYSQPMGTKYYVTTEVTDDDGNIICPAER